MYKATEPDNKNSHRRRLPIWGVLPKALAEYQDAKNTEIYGKEDAAEAIAAAGDADNYYKGDWKTNTGGYDPSNLDFTNLKGEKEKNVFSKSWGHNKPQKIEWDTDTIKDKEGFYRPNLPNVSPLRFPSGLGIEVKPEGKGSLEYKFKLDVSLKVSFKFDWKPNVFNPAKDQEITLQFELNGLWSIETYFKFDMEASIKIKMPIIPEYFSLEFQNSFASFPQNCLSWALQH